MTDELLDLVDKDDEVIGTVWKSKAHQDPSLIHREIAVAVFNKKGEVLLQRRSLNKTNSPGEWKITAAGHVDSGETPKDATEREVLEELGLKIEAKFYKKVFAKHKDKESRFIWIYYAVLERDQKLKLQKEEVMDATWILPDRIVDFAKSKNFDLKGKSYQLIKDIQKLLK